MCAIWRRAIPSPGKGATVHLEALTRRCGDAARYLPLFADAVVVTREVGGGIVPMDGAERSVA